MPCDWTTVTTVRAPGIGGARWLVVRQEDGDVGSEFVAVDSAGPAQETSF